jgi:hypothetical protein
MFLLVTLSLAEAAAAADPPAVDDPSERPIDPEEVVPKKGTNPNWGDDQVRIDEVAAGEDELCVIRTEMAVARVAFIPYAFHQRWRPCHGPERKRMSYDAFYERVGRPDLAAKEHRRNRLKITLAVSQVLTVVGGTVLVVVGAAEEDWPPAVVGLSLLLVAFPVLRIVDAGLSPMGTKVGEAERLAAEFNRAPVHRLPVSQSIAPQRQLALHVPILQLRF